MKNKSLFKRALSAVLCAVMLVSCWVFTAPSASAADTWYAGNSSVKNSSTTAHTGTSTLTSNRTGQYRVRLLVKEVTQFDEAIHDRPGGVFNSKDFPYEPGFAFGPNDSDSQRNLSGTSTSQDLGDCEVERDNSLTQHKYWCEYAKISYKTMNGSSAGADGAVWFNLGDQDQGGRQDGISGGGWNWGYFPSDDGVVIDGFPTGFTTRYYNTKAIDGKKEYYHVWLQVAKWTGTNTWNWDDYGGTCTNGKNLFGNASVDDKYCKGIADVGCNMNSNSKVNELKASQTVDASKFPYATTGTATANNTTAKTTAPTVKFTTTSSTTQINSVTLPSTSVSTVSRRVYYTDPYDQYGAVMASTIQLNYSQSGKKSYFTQNGTTTGFAYGANITGDTDTQQLRAYVTWPSASNAATALSAYSNELTVNDASYTVSFKSEDGSVTYTNTQSSFQYGHTPEYNGTTPTKTDTANPPEYTYTHDGWSATANGTKLTSLPAVTGDSNKTFYAHFSQSLIDYTVKFVNNENTEILSAEYHIGATLTEPESEQIPDTYKSVDKVYTFTGWVGTNGEVYDGTCQGAITYKPVYSDVPRQYTVTFQKEDGTVISSRDLDYGTVPSSVTGLVPALIDKDPDDTNHYTPAWSQSLDTGITGDTVFRIVYTATPHTWVSDEGVVTKEGTCTEKSIVTKTCSVCEHDVKIEGDFNSTKHDMQTIKAEPKDGMIIGDAFVCCQCSWCKKYWAAEYVDGKYTAKTVIVNPDDTQEAIPGANEAADVKSSSEKVPSPYFNSYQDGELNYYYGNRGCSLKLMKDAYVGTNTRQDFRFSGSVEIPKGVSYEIGSSNDNVIKDFGFVYSQDSHIWNDDEGKADTDQLVLDSEDPKIASMSVVNNNAANGNVTGVNGSTGRLIGENGEWSGVTFHPGIVTGNQKDPDSLTFNLVISIKAKNWKKQYAARPYITYKYHGVEYTVYDTGASDQSGDYKYSYGSVYAIAAETIIYDGDYVDYVINRFINHRSDFGEDDAQGIDWWRYYFATTWAEFEQSDYGKDYKNALARHEAAT